MPRDLTFSETYSATPGWIRVAKYEGGGDLSMAQGGNGYGGLIILRSVYSNRTNEFYIVSFNAGFSMSSFTQLASNNMHSLITKIRHTIDKNAKVSYIELYINAENPYNNLNVSMPCNVDGRALIAWKPTDGESTEETVEDVTVVSTLVLT